MDRVDAVDFGRRGHAQWTKQIKSTVYVHFVSPLSTMHIPECHDSPVRAQATKSFAGELYA